MKRILSFIFAIFLFNSCTTEEIVEVRENFFEASAFEIVLDFTPQNDYSFVEPYGFEVLPSDVTLVYISWEVDNGQDVWRLVPQTVIFEDGNDLVYNYDFTQNDVRFFLEGSNLDILGPEWTEAQAFRVVVVPAQNVGRGGDFESVDYSDLQAVMEAYDITEFPKR